jgi:hypothetical protein
MDQVELYFIEYINQHPQFRIAALRQFVDELLPAYLPSSPEWLKKLVESYCEFDSTLLLWKIKPHEKTNLRLYDIKEMKNTIFRMGQNLSFLVESESDMIRWTGHPNAPPYRFFITTTSMITQFAAQLTGSYGEETVILYPGSRAELLAFKNKHNLIYQSFLKEIHFVKFRHLRRLNDDKELSLQTWMEKIDSDPAEWKLVNQLSMF